MNSTRKFALLGAAGVSIATVAALVPGTASATPERPFAAGGRPAANPRAGVQDNAPTDLDESPVAWGQLPLTNPDTGRRHALRLQHLDGGR